MHDPASGLPMVPTRHGTLLPDVSSGVHMTGDRLMAGLILFYCLLAGVFLYEHNYPKMWYWLAAAQITASVLVMR